MLATLSLSFAWAPWPLIAPKADECPAVTTVGSANFNLTEYVRKSWYIQAQQVESYQPLDSLYCVTATYDLDGATVPFFRGTVVTVYNYGNKGAVNGPNVNKNNMTLCARATNASDTSRLAVAPCFLPNLAAGPYWLLGVGADASGELASGDVQIVAATAERAGLPPEPAGGRARAVGERRPHGRL